MDAGFEQTVLDRNFEAAAPNQRWVADTTEMLTRSGGKFYLAAIIECIARSCGARARGRSSRSKCSKEIRASASSPCGSACAACSFEFGENFIIVVGFTIARRATALPRGPRIVALTTINSASGSKRVSFLTRETRRRRDDLAGSGYGSQICA
ncbi:MAG: hypothetical protein ABI704_08390 [Kofleriaceae bacterium]